MPYDDAHDRIRNAPENLSYGRNPDDAAGDVREREAVNDEVVADAPTRDRPAAPPKENPPEQEPRKPDEHRKTDDAQSKEDGTADDKGDDKGGGEHKEKQKRRSPLLWIVLGIVALLALIGGGYYWYATKDQESTDDAYTDGRAITIAPKVSGYVSELDVTDNEFLHAGQVILKIDPRDFIAARDQARGVLEVAQGQLNGARAALAVAQKNFPARLASAHADLESAQATLARAEADDRRQHSVPRAATTQTQVDQADAALLEARANVAKAQAEVREAEPVQENIDQASAQANQIEGQVAEAKAQLDQAELNLSYTVITAPQDGWVTKRNVERGNYITAGSSLMALVSPDVWVTANFKETQLDRMRPGQHVDISVDAYPGLKLKGHVDSVQLGSGSRFTAFPAENATGNYVKIVQRVPVKILIDSGLDPNLPLPLGLSVDPTVYLK